MALALSRKSFGPDGCSLVTEAAHLSVTLSNLLEQSLRRLGGSSLLPGAQERSAVEKGGVAGSIGHHALGAAPAWLIAQCRAR